MESPDQTNLDPIHYSETLLLYILFFDRRQQPKTNWIYVLKYGTFCNTLNTVYFSTQVVCKEFRRMSSRSVYYLKTWIELNIHRFVNTCDDKLTMLFISWPDLLKPVYKLVSNSSSSSKYELYPKHMSFFSKKRIKTEFDQLCGGNRWYKCILVSNQLYCITYTWWLLRVKGWCR